MYLATSEQTQQWLRTALYRFDCPPTLTIGNYALDLLVDPERRELAGHVLGCDECADELHTLRGFLATEPAPAPRRNWHRVFATLFTPTPGLARSALRGDQRDRSSEYHAGPVHVILGALPARPRGTVALDGLVLHDALPDAVADRAVTLLAEDFNQPVHATRTDDLGNFAFESIAAGSYQLEIQFDDEVVVIPGVTLDSSA